jgi:DNA-3-methyladenine glycosylase
VSDRAARAGPGARRVAPLPASFYDRPTELVARQLLGAMLECTTRDGVTTGRNVETEAYLGPHDAACHASAGLTARTAPLFGAPGTAYVYLIYGMHWCMNAVTREVGHGAAVLVRAVHPVRGLALMRQRRPRARRDVDLTNGPGKLCAAFGIGPEHNGIALRRGPLVIRAGDAVADADVEVTPRIGITRAAELPLRFLVRDDPFVSRTPAGFARRPYAG